MPAAFRRLPLALIGAITIGLFGDSAAQEPKKSEIRGTVVRANDRQPVVGARVSLDGTEHALVTDKKGHFKFPKVVAGTYVIRAEVEGFPVATSTVLLAKGDRLDVEFQVGASDAVTLPELKVTADEPKVSPVVEFNRRATSGNGRYFTRDYI
jgi:Carboxypeptidase regulatory-like domain